MSLSHKENTPTLPERRRSVVKRLLATAAFTLSTVLPVATFDRAHASGIEPTPTPSPHSILATPEVVKMFTCEVGDTCEVNAPKLNVRSGPGTSFGIIDGMLSGDSVVVLGLNTDGTWAKIRMLNQSEGNALENTQDWWVSTKYLDVVEKGITNNTPLAVEAAPTQVAGQKVVETSTPTQTHPKTDAVETPTPVLDVEETEWSGPFNRAWAEWLRGKSEKVIMQQTSKAWATLSGSELLDGTNVHCRINGLSLLVGEPTGNFKGENIGWNLWLFDPERGPISDNPDEPNVIIANQGCLVLHLVD